MNEQQQAIFFQELAATLKAGVSVSQAVRLAGVNIRGKRQLHWQNIVFQLERGASLAASLNALGNVFSPWAVAVIGLAEKSGAVAIAAADLATTLTEMMTRRRLIRGMVLRLFRMLWSWIMVIFLLLGGVVTSWNFWLVGTLVALGLLALIYAAIHWRPLGDRLRYIPPFKRLFAFQAMINLSYLQLPLDCGMTLGSALDWMKQDFPDPVINQIMRHVEPQVRRGKALSHTIRPYSSAMVVQMIRTGEEAGTLSKSFEQIRYYYQQDLRRAVHFLNLQVMLISLISFGLFVFFAGAQMLELLVQNLPN